MASGMMALTFLILNFLILSSEVTGLESDGSTNHLRLFDSLPDGFSSQHKVPFDIRTNFSGSVQMVESRDFRLVVNITAPSLQRTYHVDADLYAHDGRVVLEVKEHQQTAGVISLVWLFVSIAVATVAVGVLTAWHAIHWYKQEKQKCDVSDHKSFASSSQRGGIYRPGNSMQMVPLGAVDHMFRTDDQDNLRNLRCDEELRQLQEMPEEEEAEAREMEQLNKLKLQGETDPSAETEDSDPQERNLIKSRFHSHAKMVHKDLIKKGSGKKAVTYRRTQNGTYEGVPTDHDENSNDELGPGERECKVMNDTVKKISFEDADLQVVLDEGVETSTIDIKKMAGDEGTSEHVYANDPGETDPLLLVLADVHKINPAKTEMVSITTDKINKPGNIYVGPSELRPAVMSTFGPGMTSTPKTGSGQPQESSTADDIFQKVAKKYSTDSSWLTSGLMAMGDIPEDPREDNQSTVSGSAKDTSMYGSSEIFDHNDAVNTYYNMDSDLEVPPLDPDDILSDGGLPSPHSYLGYKSTDRRKVNDDIKLIPGALKSPGPNAGRMTGLIKPRPNSSIILRGGPTPDPSDTPASDSDHKQGESPPLPPPPEEKGQPVPETIFEFPPPPKFYKPPQHITWREHPPGPEASEIHTQMKHSQDSDSTEKPSKPGSRGCRGTLSPTYMNLTLLSTLCFLALTSGVYSIKDSKETRVDITVFAPSHFFTNTTRVFFNFKRDTELMGSKDSSVLVYDVSRPLIDKSLEPARAACFNTSCEQGCDETNGDCICFKGYKLNNLGECIDVNECMEGKARCDPAAGCYNRKGSYDCICGEDYYGSGKTCRECKLKCPEKYYEVQPCTQEIQKICKACTLSCRVGYYMAQACSSHENTICRVCRHECLLGEFESRQCTNFHDRDCLNVTHLTAPQTSRNVVLEEKRNIKADQAKLDKLPAHYVGFTRYKLFRGTGVHLELTVRFIDAAQQFYPVNASLPFSLDRVAPTVLQSYAVQRYCQAPVPDYYILRYKKHEGVTYKQNENGSIDACETHKPAGEFLPSVTGNNQSFLCSQPGSLTNIFSIDEDFFLARTKWVDKSKRCQRNSRACELCTRKCGTDNMFSGDPTCSAAGTAAGDNDAEESPRLMMCYNCCVKRNCSTDCKDYHKRRCQPEQCSKGNLLEFTLEPSWDSSQEGRFFCHIGPAPRQHLLELDYTIHAEASITPLYTNKVMIYGNEKWEKDGVMHHSDGILNIVINSSLGTVPDFVEGVTNLHNGVFKVGSYKSHGGQFGSSAVRPEFVFIRPPLPHGIPTMPGAHQECTHMPLNQMVLASNMENPYIQDRRLEAVANNSPPFIVTSKTQDPVVTAFLPRDTSILRKVFPQVTLDLDSISLDLTQNSTHWLVTVQGRVKLCPGFLQISLLDPNYPSEVLFDCDTAILCPSSFSIAFALPSTDKLGMHKDVVVIITDDKGDHHFRVYRRASIKAEVGEDIEDEMNVKPMVQDVSAAFAVREEKEKKNDDVDEVEEVPDLPLDFPYLLIICGAIVLLLVLAVLGLCFQPALPMPETHHARWYHPIFATAYMMFQFVYSCLVSGTVFFLILTVITSHHVEFVVNHGQPGAVSTASSHIELLQLQRHLEREINRQDAQTVAAQKVCVQDVKKIVIDMKKLHRSLLDSTKDVFERHRLDLLLSQQKLHVRDKLSRDLENFRSAYAKAARSVLKQVNQNALASFHNVQYNNTWLDGARFLHEAVMLLMKAKNKQQKSFMEWTGIKADLAKLEIDLTFSLPALPRLDDIPVPPPDPPPIKRDSPKQLTEKDPIRSIQVHNNWFFPLEESGLGGALAFQAGGSDDPESSEKETSSAFFIFLAMFITCDIILLAHRMCKAWTVAKLILFGFPEYFREQKENECGDDDVFQSKESKSKLTPVNGCRDSPLYQNIKMFLIQTISTTFFPKIVGAAAAFTVLMCVLDFSNKYLTVQEMARAGLYHNTDQYLDLQTTLTNARLQTHADYINTVDFPAFQASMSSYISRHRSVLTMYHKHLTGLQNLTTEMYCKHLRAIDFHGNCSHSSQQSDVHAKESWDTIVTMTHACKFQPVEPKLFIRTLDDKSNFTERQMGALLESLRFIIYYTSRLIVIYLAGIVLKELASAVLWILIQRSGVIRLRVIVERDQDDTVQ